MPYPVGGDGRTETEGASIVPRTGAAVESDEVEVTAVAASVAEETAAAEESSAVDVLTTLMATMSGDEDWTYDREAMVSDVETLLTALGVDHHDIKELTDMLPPEDGGDEPAGHGRNGDQRSAISWLAGLTPGHWPGCFPARE